MPIEFACESCTKLLRVPDGTAGSSCQCPACGTLLVIPDPNAIKVVEQAQDSQGANRISIPCPKCSYQLECDSSLAGTKGQCPQCKYIFLISDDPNRSGTAAEAQTGLVFSCPKCDQLFEGKEEMRGRKGKCHACGEVFAIELREAEEPHVPTMEISQSKPNVAAEPSQATMQLACSKCQGVMEVPASAAGQTTACPYCQQLLQIPAASSTTPSPRKSPSPSTGRSPTSGSTTSTSQPASSESTSAGTGSTDAGSAGGGLFPASATTDSSGTATSQGNDIWGNSLDHQSSNASSSGDVWTDLGDQSGQADYSNPYAEAPTAPVNYAQHQPQRSGGDLPSGRSSGNYLALGICLLLLSALLLLLATFNSVRYLPQLGRIATAPADVQSRIVGAVAAIVICIAFAGIYIVGGISFIQRRSLTTAKIAAVFACIPCVCLVLNIPFGVWACFLAFSDAAERDFRS